MTSRVYVKCAVCAAITLIRVQAGWLDWHPVAVPCGKCGISLSGKAYLDQQEGTIRFEFANADKVNETVPAYYLEVSSEFVTDKLRDYTGGEFIWSPPPYFQALSAMGMESSSKFQRNSLLFLRSGRQDWPKVKRVNELWFGGQYQYLAEEIRKHLSNNRYPMNNDLDYLRVVHHLNLSFLWPVLDRARFKKTTKFLFGSLRKLVSSNPAELRALVEYFEHHKLLEAYEVKLSTTLDILVDRFPYLLPAFSLRFYAKRPRGLISKKGITTASFEDVKHFYAEMFEAAADVLPLAIAYNNLQSRGLFAAMKSIRRDVTTLDELLSKSKGERVQYLDGEEPFDRLLFPHLENKLRNAIAHASYRNDSRKQLITYFPSGVEGRGPARLRAAFMVAILLRRRLDGTRVPNQKASFPYSRRL